MDVTKNPTFSTEIQSSLAGREVRVQNFQNPIWEFTLAYEYLLTDPRSRDENEQTPLETLVGFFLARGGQFDDFLLNESDLTQRLEDSVYSRPAHRDRRWHNKKLSACSQLRWIPGSLPESGEPGSDHLRQRNAHKPRILTSSRTRCSLRMRPRRGIPSRRILLSCTACDLMPGRHAEAPRAVRAKELNSATSISICMSAKKCS